MIIKRNNMYVLVNRSGQKVLGRYKTRKQAEAQKRELELRKAGKRLGFGSMI